MAATAAFPAGAAPPAAARISISNGSATAALAYTVAGPAALRIGGQDLEVGGAEAGLVVINVRAPWLVLWPCWAYLAARRQQEREWRQMGPANLHIRGQNSDGAHALGCG